MCVHVGANNGLPCSSRVHVDASNRHLTALQVVRVCLEPKFLFPGRVLLLRSNNMPSGPGSKLNRASTNLEARISVVDR